MLISREQRDGEPRFTLLETIREYASERFDDRAKGEGGVGRHGGYYLEWAEARARRRQERRALRRLRRLEDEEHENVRAALGWARR